LTVWKATGQDGLRYGADDLGSIMLEENVLSVASVIEKCMTNDAMISLIHDEGRLPGRRDTTYRVLETFARGGSDFVADRVHAWVGGPAAPWRATALRNGARLGHRATGR
jgi:cyclic dehypoxanthinyl futalosine synthase